LAGKGGQVFLISLQGTPLRLSFLGPAFNGR
jgi:hypothetical protein